MRLRSTACAHQVASSGGTTSEVSSGPSGVASCSGARSYTCGIVTVWAVDLSCLVLLQGRERKRCRCRPQRLPSRLLLVAKKTSSSKQCGVSHKAAGLGGSGEPAALARQTCSATRLWMPSRAVASVAPHSARRPTTRGHAGGGGVALLLLPLLLMRLAAGATAPRRRGGGRASRRGSPQQAGVLLLPVLLATQLPALPDRAGACICEGGRHVRGNERLWQARRAHCRCRASGGVSALGSWRLAAAQRLHRRRSEGDRFVAAAGGAACSWRAITGGGTTAGVRRAGGRSCAPPLFSPGSLPRVDTLVSCTGSQPLTAPSQPLYTRPQPGGGPAGAVRLHLAAPAPVGHRTCSFECQ